MDPYGTHQPALVAACLMTSGPILELGCGHYSTPILLEIATAQKRLFVSLESDDTWRMAMQALYPDADIRPYDLWIEAWLSAGMTFGVVFVDHAPGERRVPDIKRLAPRTKLFVIHDSDDPAYGYNAIWPLFSWRRDWTERTPHTAIVSR